eukprot:SAG25_NODE_668_length_6042_cov_5.337540_3_plen_198_part_00
MHASVRTTILSVCVCFPALTDVTYVFIAGMLGEGQHAEAEQAEALQRVLPTTSVAEAVRGCQLVVEAVADDLATKGPVYSSVLVSCPTDAVLATTSMNLTLEEIQELLPSAWRKRLIGLRFFAPVVGVSVVEVCHKLNAQNAEVKQVCDIFCSMHKTLVQGPTDADRPHPYIGPGYETTTDLLSAGISEADLAHLQL